MGSRGEVGGGYEIDEIGAHPASHLSTTMKFKFESRLGLLFPGFNM